MSANGGLTADQVKKGEGMTDRSVNGPKSQSSPIYGNRKQASSGTSNGGAAGCESGFLMAPNSKKGPRR